MNDCDVIIVGAGPTGLMAACQLSRLGISFRIIEKTEQPNTQSRALAIHAASMEIFAQMGIADQFLDQGKKVKAINYLVKGNVERRIPLSDFGSGLTEFPFLLILDQSKTEQLLRNFLEKRGHKVEWAKEIIDLAQDNDLVKATVKHKGAQEILQAKWLIAADGAKSFVRQHFNVPFGGQTYPQELFVLDCKVNWNLKDDEMYIAFSDYSFAGFFPMPEDRCRIIGFVPLEARSKQVLGFEDIEKGFAERMQMDVKLSSAKWVSRYHAHHRYVSHFRIQRCFLAGDSAHIHSPVGAQGMNTGLQDAFNLSWKLAFVIKGWAKDNILSTYEEERLPFARRLVNSTDRAFAVTVSQNPFLKIMRMYFAPRLMAVVLKFKPLESFIFKNISQIGIQYPETILTYKPFKKLLARWVVQPGERLPYLKYENGIHNEANIQKCAHGISLHLLIFIGESKEENSGLMELLKQYVDIITFEIIPLTNRSINLYKSFGIKTMGLYLLRPDLYIAYRSSAIDAKLLKEYLSRFLLSKVELK